MPGRRSGTAAGPPRSTSPGPRQIERTGRGHERDPCHPVGQHPGACAGVLAAARHAGDGEPPEPQGIREAPNQPRVIRNRVVVGMSRGPCPDGRGRGPGGRGSRRPRGSPGVRPPGASSDSRAGTVTGGPAGSPTSAYPTMVPSGTPTRRSDRITAIHQPFRVPRERQGTRETRPGTRGAGSTDDGPDACWRTTVRKTGRRDQAAGSRPTPSSDRVASAASRLPCASRSKADSRSIACNQRAKSFIGVPFRPAESARVAAWA